MEWLAFTPILLVLVLVFFRFTLFESSLMTLFYTFAISVLFWRVESAYVYGSLSKGILTGIDIAIVICGALVFIKYFSKTGRLVAFEKILAKISDDKRVHIIFLTWFFVAFLEGTAGFGTPAAVVVPLLVGIGVRPLYAVCMALVANGFCAGFGAVGTPVLIGLAEFTSFQGVWIVGLVMGVLSLLGPVIILFLYEKSQANPDFAHVKEMIPFALWSGFVFGVVFFLSSLLGPEFPTLLGGLLGGVIVYVTSKQGLFMPKRVSQSHLHADSEPNGSKFHAGLPYMLFILFLVCAKFLPLSIPVNLTKTIAHSFSFANPGIIFFFTLAVMHFVTRESWNFRQEFRGVLKVLIKPLVTVIAISAFVQMMVYSGFNVLGLPSMIEVIASVLQFGLWFFAPFVGALGALVSGSTTVSNLLFGLLQENAAIAIGFPVSVVLALQVMGASLGNMVSLTNIMAAQATAHMDGEEKSILKITGTICLVLLGVLGIIGVCIGLVTLLMQ